MPEYDPTIDYNFLASEGIHFCASCGELMEVHHDSGHCKACRKKGIG